MSFVIGYLNRRPEDDLPRSLAGGELEFVGKKQFTLHEAVLLAEGLTEKNRKENNEQEIVIVSSRALSKVSGEHPELDLTWSNMDDPIMKNDYLCRSAEKWEETESITSRQSSEPSVYFDLDGTLSNRSTKDLAVSSLEEMLDPANHYFRNIEPHPYMISLANKLRAEGMDVCIIASTDRNTMRDKIEWINKNLPFIPKENIFFAPIGADRSQFIKGNAEISILIDRYEKDLSRWKGLAIKAVDDASQHQARYPEIEIKEDGKTYSEGHAERSAVLVKELLDNAYDKAKEYHDDYIKSDHIYKYVEASLRNSGDKFTLMTAAQIKENAKDMCRDNYSAERENAINELINNYIDKQAERILDKEIARHKTGYEIILSRKKIEAELIRTAYDKFSDDLKKHADKKDELHFRDYLEKEVYIKQGLYKNEADIIDPRFQSTNKDSEVDIVKYYLKNKEKNIYEALKDRGFMGIHIDVTKYVGEHNIKLVLKTDTEQKTAKASISDMFCNGNIEDLSASLSKMSEADKIDRFDNALTYLVHQQGYDLGTLAQGYLGSKNINEFINTTAAELKAYPSSPAAENEASAELTAYVTIDGGNLDVLDRIAKGSNEGIRLSKETMIGLYNNWSGESHIKLEKPFEITGDMVSSIQITNNDGSLRRWDYCFTGRAESIGGENSRIMTERPSAKEIKDVTDYVQKLDTTIKNKSTQTIDK